MRVMTGQDCGSNLRALVRPMAYPLRRSRLSPLGDSMRTERDGHYGGCFRRRDQYRDFARVGDSGNGVMEPAPLTAVGGDSRHPGVVVRDLLRADAGVALSRGIPRVCPSRCEPPRAQTARVSWPISEPAATASAEMPAPNMSAIGNRLPGPTANKKIASPMFAPAQRQIGRSTPPDDNGRASVTPTTIASTAKTALAMATPWPLLSHHPVGVNRCTAAAAIPPIKASTKAWFIRFSPTAGAGHVDARAGRDRADGIETECHRGVAGRATP